MAHPTPLCICTFMYHDAVVVQVMLLAGHIRDCYLEFHQSGVGFPIMDGFNVFVPGTLIITFNIGPERNEILEFLPIRRQELVAIPRALCPFFRNRSIPRMSLDLGVAAGALDHPPVHGCEVRADAADCSGVGVGDCPRRCLLRFHCDPSFCSRQSKARSMPKQGQYVYGR